MDGPAQWEPFLGGWSGTQKKSDSQAEKLYGKSNVIGGGKKSLS